MANEILILANTIEYRDIYTKGHSERVGVYAADFAHHLGFDKKRARDFYMAGLLHDLGKIAIPDRVLLKPSALDDEEFNLIKYHPTLSAQIVEQFAPYIHLSDLVKYHHEYYDGSGYPEGLSGEAIPEGARILTLVDVFDALTTPRIYREALSLQEAIEIIQKEASRYDPYLLKEFIPFVKKKGVIDQSSGRLKQSVEEQLRINLFFVDTLTKALNREGLLAIIRKSTALRESALLIEVNIHHFKAYNRLHGLTKGDRMLKKLSQQLIETFNCITSITDIQKERFYLARTKADRFALFYIGKKVDYIHYKLQHFQKRFKEEQGVEITIQLLGQFAHLDAKTFNEIGYLL